MPESTATGKPESETQTGATPQDETSTQATSETLETTTETSSSDSAKELESLKAALKKANSEAAANRKAAKELSDLKAQAEEAGQTAQQKLEKQLKDLQTAHDTATKTLQERTVNYEVKLQASQQGLDPTLAAKLITPGEVTFDEDGSPNNIADLLKSLIKTYPNLVGKQQAQTSGGATNPSKSASTGAAQINEQFVRDVLSGKLPNDTYSKLAPEQRVQFLNVQQSMGRR